MKIHDKTRVKPLKINGKFVIIRYDDWTPNKYELCYGDEDSSPHPKLYVYNTGGKYIFGEYIEYRSTLTDLSNLNIQQQLFDFLLKNTTNVEYE